MKIPDGYALIKISDMPKIICESIKTVMRQKRITLVNAITDEQIVREMGNNAAGSLALSDASEDLAVSDEICPLCGNDMPCMKNDSPDDLKGNIGVRLSK